MVGDMKQHQDRLLDTAAHLSNELGVNQEHVKVGEDQRLCNPSASPHYGHM